MTFAAYALELAEPPGLLDYALQGPPPNPDNNKPWRGLVESRASGSFWTYMVISEVSGKWEEAYGTVTEGTPLDALTRTARRAWNGTALVTNTKVDWQPSDGPLRVFATPIADVYDGLINHHRGPTAPPWARPGTTWDDDSGAPTSVVFKKMDAAGTWRVIGVMNETTGVFTPAGGPFLPLATGGTVTGPVVVSAAFPQVAIDAAADRGVAFRSAAGLMRGAVGYSLASNVIAIWRYDDAGAFLGTPLLINRTSGDTTIANALTVGGATALNSALNVAGIANMQGTYTAHYGDVSVCGNGGAFVPSAQLHVADFGVTTALVQARDGNQARLHLANSNRSWLHYIDAGGSFVEIYDFTGGAAKVRVNVGSPQLQVFGDVSASGHVRSGGEVSAANDLNFRMMRSGVVSYFQATADDWMQFNDSASSWDLVLAGAGRLGVTPTQMIWGPAGHAFLIDGIFHFRTFPTAGLPSAAVYGPTWVARTSAPGDWAATNDGATWQLMHFV